MPRRHGAHAARSARRTEWPRQAARAARAAATARGHDLRRAPRARGWPRRRRGRVEPARRSRRRPASSPPIRCGSGSCASSRAPRRAPPRTPRRSRRRARRSCRSGECSWPTLTPRVDSRQPHRPRSHRVSLVPSGDRPRLDPDVRRHAAGRADLAARGRRARPGAGDPRVPPLPQGRRVRRSATRTTTPTSPATATRACASTCAAAATPTASCSTSTCRRSRTTALEVIAWLAAQPWCTGTVGMIGISWGGFNGLQVAARRPPALKAVISMCASDDRYADDVHYVGGCVLGVDMLPWAATMLTLLRPAARPGRGRRRLARDLARAHGAHARDGRGLARPPAPRRLLAPRLGLRGLRADRGPRVRGRRLGGRLLERGPAAARGAARPAQGPDRPVVARVPAGRRARPGHRLPPGVPALVGPLAQGRSTPAIMDEPRAARLDAGLARRRPTTTPSGRGAGSPRPAWPPPSSRERASSACSRASSRSSIRSVESTGADAGAWCAGRRRGRLAAGPARRGRALAAFTSSRSTSSRSRSSASRRSSWTLAADRPERAPGRAPVRRRARRLVAAGHARPAQPDPPRRPRRAASRSSRAAATR